MCVIDGINFFGMEPGNIAQLLNAGCDLAPSIFDPSRQLRTLQSQNSHFVKLEPFLMIVIVWHQPPKNVFVRAISDARRVSPVEVVEDAVVRNTANSQVSAVSALEG
jgi:hypothetical protein